MFDKICFIIQIQSQHIKNDVLSNIIAQNYHIIFDMLVNIKAQNYILTKNYNCYKSIQSYLFIYLI